MASDTGLASVHFLDEEPPAPADGGNAITEATARQLGEYFAGTRRVFDLPLEPAGSSFQQKVWQQLLLLSFGQTDTYSAIARRLQNPLSVRAVGAANGRNPIAVIIPCHRVIGADGSLTGYAGGLSRKEFLLHHENPARRRQLGLW